MNASLVSASEQSKLWVDGQAVGAIPEPKLVNGKYMFPVDVIFQLADYEVQVIEGGGFSALR